MTTRPTPPPTAPPDEEFNYATFETLPRTYQEITDHFSAKKSVAPFALRKETFLRIERATQRPLIAYVTKLRNVQPGAPAFVEDGDLVGFQDLITNVPGDVVDILLISNGGSAEASERIVRLLRNRFRSIRFILPSNAFSAATLISLSGDEIVMGPIGTLGPIDPQINGVPARAIVRAFETLEKRLADEGPRALTAYMPLIAKYDLHILEICKSAAELSEELARDWLSRYMLHCDPKDDAVNALVDFFKSYDVHKSHGRSIDRARAREMGLRTVVDTEATHGLTDLLQSLISQYDFWFEKTPFFKMFEDARATNWGRQAQVQQVVQLPFPVPTTPPVRP